MFAKLHLTTAQTFVLHSLLSLLIGGIGAASTAAGQAAFSAGNFDPRLVIGAGIAAFGAWFVHGFVSLKNSPQTQTALLDTAKEFSVAPALVPDIEKFAQLVAVELFKIKTPPVASLQGQQTARPVQQSAQPSQQNRPVQSPVNNPTAAFQGNQSYIPNQQYGGGGYPQQQQPSQFWDLSQAETGNVPQYPAQSGRPG